MACGSVTQSSSVPIVQRDSAITPNERWKKLSLGSKKGIAETIGLRTVEVIVNIICFLVLGDGCGTIFDWKKYYKQDVCVQLRNDLLRYSTIDALQRLNNSKLVKFGVLSETSQRTLNRFIRDAETFGKTIKKANKINLKNGIEPITYNTAVDKLNKQWIYFRDNELKNDLPSFEE